MAIAMTCPQGHQWQVEGSAQALGLCPSCGATGTVEEEETPDELDSDSTRRALPRDPAASKSPDGPTMLRTKGQVKAPARGTLVVAGYDIIGELGRGGMGVVYKARQLGLNRLVALKMVLAAKHAGPQELARFRHEAEVVAQLQHPNIVQVHEVGESDGRPYFSLELVEGGSLAGQLKGVPWSARHASQLLQKLATAMDAAHQRGIIHRDLKPANVLIAADGTPKITDFGLAKRLDDSAGPTQSGAILGTPSYMAPEQAGGKLKEIGPPTDVYALGAILYELLTGRPPFRAETPWETVTQVMHQEPVPPCRIQPNLPRDLETICLKCLQKQPGQRYESTKLLADDLGRFLAGDPIKARAVGLGERFYKWMRRQPVVTTLLTFLLLISLTGLLASLTNQPVAALIAAAVPVTAISLGGVIWQWQRAEAQKRRVEEQRQQADAARREAEELRQRAEIARRDAEEHACKAAEALVSAKASLYFLQISLAEREWLAANVGRVDELLDACPLPLRQWEWYYLKQLCHPELFVLRGHTRPVMKVAASPDGQQLASAGWDQTIMLWDTATGKMIGSLPGHEAQVTCLAYSPDGRVLASGGGDQVVHLWDAQTGQKLLTLTGHQLSVLSLAFSPNGQRLASGGGDQLVRVWDIGTGKQLLCLRGHSREVTAVAFSPHGRFIASGGGDQAVKVWDAPTGQLVTTYSGHTGGVLSVDFSPDGMHVASVGEDRAVKIWQANSGREVHTCRGHSGTVFGVAFSPDGKLLASCGWDKIIKLWDPADGKHLFTLRGHAGIVSSLAFSPDGKRLASSSEDQTVRVWNATSSPEVRTLHGHGNSVLALAFSPDGLRLGVVSGRLFGHEPGEVGVWELAGEPTYRVLAGSLQGVRCLAISPDAKFLACGLENGKALILDLASGAEVFALTGHSRTVAAVAFSPDSQTLATAGEDGIVRIWSTASGEATLTIRPNIGPIASMTCSRDGRLLALAGKDRLKGKGEIKLCDSQTGKHLLTFGDRPLPVAGLAFSPDNLHLASANQDKTIQIWETATGEEVFRLRGHTGVVTAVAFSPNGRRLISASHDHTIKIWDTTSGQEILTLRGHSGEVLDLTFSPDGQRIASASMDETVKVWDASPPLAAANLESEVPLGQVPPDPGTPEASNPSNDLTNELRKPAQNGTGDSDTVDKAPSDPSHPSRPSHSHSSCS